MRIAGADLRRFEFDYDLTWFVFLLDADETIYGRYGGRDAKDSEARLSLAGLRYAMEQALEALEAPPPPRPLAGKPFRAEDFTAARRFTGCIHCHNVNEFRRADLKEAGKWDRNDLWVYPLPENVGLTLERDVGNRVQGVTPRSPAEKAGLRTGDLVRRLNSHPVASFADASYALHKAPWKGRIPITWTRAGRETSAVLEVAEGWRKTNLTWRPSMLDLLPSLPFSGDDLGPGEKKRLGLAEGRACFRQDATVHASLAAVGVRGGDVIVGFDGKAIDGKMGDLLGHVRRNYLVGDAITINILRGGKRVDVALVLR